MLPPDRRSLYSDALRPPPGWSLDRAVGATYSLDLATLLVFPLHLSLLDTGRRGEEVLRDGVAVLESLRRLTSRIAIFTQQGQVHAPGVPHMLYSLLEPIVFEVRPQQAGGVFHAKFWLLRFIGLSDDEVLLRLVIPTRNITTDRCWDVVLALEGHPARRPIAANRGIRDMITELPKLSRKWLPESLVTSMSALADEAYRTHWQLPGDFEEVHLHALGLRPREWLPPQSKRLAVISPFLTDTAIVKLAQTSDEPVALVSRAEELARIPKQSLAAFDRTLILHQNTDADDVPEEGIGGPPLSGLHAKVYIAECGRDTHLMIGSANATSAGLLGRNVEIMAELIGRKSRVGSIDDLLGSDVLGGVLAEFVPPDQPVVETAEERAAHEALFRAQVELSECGLRVVCTQDGSDWSCALHTAARVQLAGIESGCAWPSTRPSTIAADLLPLRAGAIAWSPGPAETITGLIAFELQAAGSEERLRFVLNVPVEGIDADRRDGAILRAVLSNREGFLRYLLLLLADDPLLSPEPPFGDDDKKPMEWIRAGEIAPLLEEMTRALHRDPERLRAIGQTLKRLGEDEGQLVPPEFTELWSAFEHVLEEGP